SFFFQAEDGIRDGHVTGVQTRALPISDSASRSVVAGGTPSVQEVEVRRVRISKTDRCQVIMELGGRVHYQAVRLSDPDRIYFDRSEERRVGKECRWRLTPSREKRKRV